MLSILKPTYAVPFLESDTLLSINSQIEQDYLLRKINMRHLTTDTLEESREYQLPEKVLPYGNGESGILFVLKGGLPVDKKTTIPFSDSHGYIMRHMMNLLKHPFKDHYYVTATDALENEKVDPDLLFEAVAHRVIPVITVLKPKLIIVMSEHIGDVLSQLLDKNLLFRQMTQTSFDFMNYHPNFLVTYSPVWMLTPEGNSYKSAIYSDLSKAFMLP